MESFKPPTNPAIKHEVLEDLPIRAQAVFDLVRKMKINEGRIFEFDGTQYQVIWLNKKEVTADGGEASFEASTQIAGFDIYMLKSLSPEVKKRQLFHEILESNLVTWGVPSKEAHNIVLVQEERLFGKR